jgi:hypothetical protein
MALKKLKTPIPLDRWFNDIKSVESLRELIDSDYFQQAAAILKDTAGPNHASLSVSPEENNLRHAWYAGYRDAFADLSKLTKLPISNNTNQLNEWNHILNP